MFFWLTCFALSDTCRLVHRSGNTKAERATGRTKFKPRPGGVANLSNKIVMLIAMNMEIVIMF